MKNFTSTATKFYLLLFICASSLFSGLINAAAKDDPLIGMFQIDQLEWRDAEEEQYAFEAEGWIGKDLTKIWLKAELEHSESENEGVELQLLYGKAISPYWDFQIGMRRDFKPEPHRRWLVLGFQGLSPYFFEINTALFIGDDEQVGLRLEAEYELMITQRLLITPEWEVNFYSKDDDATGVGSGLADMEFGLRLQYEVRREFAPYIGVNWEGSFGHTADMAEAEGEDTSETQFVIGVHAWF